MQNINRKKRKIHEVSDGIRIQKNIKKQAALPM